MLAPIPLQGWKLGNPKRIADRSIRSVGSAHQVLIIRDAIHNNNYSSGREMFVPARLMYAVFASAPKVQQVP